MSTKELMEAAKELAESNKQKGGETNWKRIYNGMKQDIKNQEMAQDEKYMEERDR